MLGQNRVGDQSGSPCELETKEYVEAITLLKDAPRALRKAAAHQDLMRTAPGWQYGVILHEGTYTERDRAVAQFLREHARPVLSELNPWELRMVKKMGDVKT